MQVETSREAVGERIDELLGWLTGPDSGQNDGITETVRVLRAILSERDAATARAEAAERERDEARNVSDAWAEQVSNYAAQRDAATAERDRLREALRPQLGKNARRSLEELAEAMEASGDAADATALRFLLERQDAARAALAGAAKEPSA